MSGCNVIVDHFVLPYSLDYHCIPIDCGSVHDVNKAFVGRLIALSLVLAIVS